MAISLDDTGCERRGQGGMGAVAAVMDAADEAVLAFSVAAIVDHGDSGGGAKAVGFHRAGFSLRARHDHGQRQQQCADEA